MLRAFATTDRGPIRRTNEDAFVIDDELGVLIVADGMGGHAAGDVASRLAVEAIVGFLKRSHGEHEYSWPYGIEPHLSLNGNRLRTAIHLANRRVFRAGESHDEYTGMGTTVVCALIAGHQMIVGHVGDSRLYLLRDGLLTQTTQDDSWAAMVLGSSAFGPDAAQQHPMRNVLTNVLGAREQTDVHLQEQILAEGDRLLLCTDGLHGTLDLDALAAVLAEGTDARECADALVKKAIDGGTRDNVTALVAFCEGASHG